MVEMKIQIQIWNEIEIEIEMAFINSIEGCYATVTLLTSGVDVERLAEIARHGYECIKL